jgi:hypothetical protein
MEAGLENYVGFTFGELKDYPTLFGKFLSFNVYH